MLPLSTRLRDRDLPHGMLPQITVQHVKKPVQNERDLRPTRLTGDPYFQISMAVLLTVAEVFCAPLFTVNCRFWGALAVTVTVPGAEQVASPVEPMVAAVVLVFQERPSTCDRLRLFPLAKCPVAV